MGFIHRGGRTTDTDWFETVRELVLAEGWNATVYQLLNPGIVHWHDAAIPAAAGWMRHAGVVVVAGAPVCKLLDLPRAVESLESTVDAHGWKVCYFQAEARLTSVLRGRRSHSIVSLGAQPVWDPRRWDEIIRNKSSLRAQLHRASNKGVRVEEMNWREAERESGLGEVLRRWLRSRGLPPLHFLVEPNTLSNLRDRRIFVARRNDAIIGFLNASPIPQRSGWLIEQFVRDDNAPNGTIELLIDAFFRTVGSEDARYATLGLSPLSDRHLTHVPENPLWLRLFFHWLRAHGTRFYNFAGLESFKAKLEPDSWEPIYAIYNRPRFSVQALYAIAGVFSGGSPIRLLTHAVLHALREEVARLASRVRNRLGARSLNRS